MRAPNKAKSVDLKESLEKELMQLRSAFLKAIDELEHLKATARLKELEYLKELGYSSSEGYFLEIGKDGVSVMQTAPKVAATEA